MNSPFSDYEMPLLSLTLCLASKSVEPDINIVIQTSLCLLFTLYVTTCSFTFNLPVFLYLRYLSCRQKIVQSCFFIHSYKPCLWNWSIYVQFNYWFLGSRSTICSLFFIPPICFLFLWVFFFCLLFGWLNIFFSIPFLCWLFNVSSLHLFFCSVVVFRDP